MAVVCPPDPDIPKSIPVVKSVSTAEEIKEVEDLPDKLEKKQRSDASQAKPLTSWDMIRQAKALWKNKMAAKWEVEEEPQHEPEDEEQLPEVELREDFSMSDSESSDSINDVFENPEDIYRYEEVGFDDEPQNPLEEIKEENDEFRSSVRYSILSKPGMTENEREKAINNQRIKELSSLLKDLNEKRVW